MFKTVRAERSRHGLPRLIVLCACLTLSGLVNAYSYSSYTQSPHDSPQPSSATSSLPAPRAYDNPPAEGSPSSAQPVMRETRQKAAGRSLSATFVNPGLRGERFWDMVTATMQAAAQDLNIRLEVVYAERNPYRLKALAVEALERSAAPDYLLLVNEEQAASQLLTFADGQDTHIVMLLNGLTREEALTHGTPGAPHTSWIGSVIPDNHDAGRRMATRLLEAARHDSPTGQLRAMALIGDTRTPASIARNAGMMEGFAEDEALQLDRVLEARWNRQDAEHLAGQYLEWISAKGHTDLIWAANDAMAEGAIRALESAGLAPGVDVLVAGLNWSPEGVGMVADRRMLLTDGGHFMAGAWAMVIARDHADLENWQPRTVRFPMSAITHDNVARYGPLLTEPDWTDVDFSGFRLQSPEDVYDFDPMNVLTQMLGYQPPHLVHRPEASAATVGTAGSHRTTATSR